MKLLACVYLTGTIWTAMAGSSSSSWPAFRGPNSSGVLADANPPVNVSPTNLVLWKIEMPFSPSSPCIWGHHLFITAYADHELQTRCYDRASGKLLWSSGIKPEALETFHRTESSPAATTPATDGKRVVSYFGSFGLLCYDLNGKELWRHPLPLALSLGGYGTASCPLIAHGLVIVSHDRDDASSLVAVDLRTGKRVWQAARPDSYGSFGTPIVWRNGHEDEVVVPGSLKLKGYDLKTGHENWTVSGVAPFACTTPVEGEGMVFFAAWSDGKSDAPWPTWEQFVEKNDKNKDGAVELTELSDESRDYYRGFDVNRDGKIDRSDWDLLMAALSKGENVLVAVKPGGHGNITDTHVAWKTTRGLPYTASPLLYEGRLYFVKNGGMLSCLDPKSGNPFYSQERLNAEGYYYASPVAAAGRIYLASQTGRFTVVKAGGDKPEILHQADFGEKIYASPALAENNLYLRTYTHLYAFGAAKSQVINP